MNADLSRGTLRPILGDVGLLIGVSGRTGHTDYSYSMTAKMRVTAAPNSSVLLSSLVVHVF